MKETFTTCYKSPIGLIEITSSEKGITSLRFTNGKKRNQKQSKYLDDCVKQLDEYFNRKRKTFSLKIILIGTEFQKKVWNELLKIPFGKTVSYKDVAVGIGNHKAVRALGNANNKNNISIIIPCHRVIGSNGKLVGYGGELWRKKWLIGFENECKQKQLY
ncbi:methylated-DNA--[protein]-cysteine S-methyltransferase [Bacteroidota bacterium]